MTDQPQTILGMLHLLQLETEPHTIGRLCESRDCHGLARWRVPWPGQGSGLRCDRHMHAAVKIADALGFELAGVEAIAVGRINEPVEDPAVARFAAMEMT